MLSLLLVPDRIFDYVPQFIPYILHYCLPFLRKHICICITKHMLTVLSFRHYVCRIMKEKKEFQNLVTTLFAYNAGVKCKQRKGIRC
jgi:hypothetical protein